VILNIREATYSVDDIEYDPAPSVLALLTVYPVEVEFLSVTVNAEPDVIDPDVDEDGVPGFTVVEVLVDLHSSAFPGGNPVSGIDVFVTIDPAIPTITPESATTDGNGRATFTVTSTDLPSIPDVC